jgi:hypothetical protein
MPPGPPHWPMNTRLIISLLCAGALAFACGPRSHSEAPVALASMIPVSSKPAVERPRRLSSARAEVKLTSHLKVDVRSDEVRFALNVRNIGGKHAELDFQNGQTHDFVVVDSAGRAVWQWSRGRIFTQMVQNKQLGSGESLQLDESVTRHAIPSGRYTAVATLNSSNYPTEQRVDFVIP